MNNEENNFEEFLRSKLEDHTVEVSDSVWAGIEKKQKKREVFIWFKHYLNVFIALDIAFILGFAAFTVLNSNEVQSQNQLSHISEYNSFKKADETVIAQQKVTPVQNVKNDIIKNQTTNENLNPENSSTTNIPLKIVNKKTISKSTKLNTSGKTKIAAQENIESTFPVHEAAATKANQEPLFAFASIKPNDINVIQVVFSSNTQINDQIENPAFLPASLMLSKSKKVVRAEQKALAKEQKELAKQIEKANTQAEAIKKNEKTEHENKTLNAASEAPISNTNEEAPLALDTVYGHKKFKGYVALDALLSPDLALRSLKGTNEQAQNYISRRDSAESLRLSYSALMRVNLFITKNIFVNTGISFSQRKEKFGIEHKWQTHEDYIDSTKYVTFVDPFEGNIIYKTYDTLDYVRTQKETIAHDVVMSFVDIPAMVGYKWLGKRSGFALQAGVICNLLFKQKGTVANYNYSANDVSKNNQNPFNTSAGLSLAGGISTNYRLNDKLDLLIEPHTRYILKPITTAEYPVQQKLFTYGLNIGLRLKL